MQASPEPGRLAGQRLDTFVDAAFAFALTLLVISFDEVPASYDELLLALRRIPAFAASFAIIVMLWVAHRNWSRRYALRDTPSLLISLLLVFVVMIYVYPLRAMMSGAMHAMTGGWAPSEFAVRSAAEARGLFTVYGAGFAAAVFCIVGLHATALRAADRLRLTPYEAAIGRAEVAVWSLVGGIGLLSIVLAQTLPDRWVPLAAWSYTLLAFLAPALAVFMTRRAERLR